MKIETTIVGIVLAGFLLSGCATKSELEEVRAMTEQAQNIGNAAVACCAIEQERITRLYTKMMSK